MSVFEVGDRVECVIETPSGNDDIHIGCTGTVVVVLAYDSTDIPVGVEWDVPVRGGYSINRLCKYGHGWRVSPTEIKLIEDDFEPATVEDLERILLAK